MRLRITTLILSLLMLALAIPAAAQTGTRAPIEVTAASINNGANAKRFHPAASFVVTGVENATNEPTEPDHTCQQGYESRSVWFTTDLMPGTITLDTTGSVYTISNVTGTSYDTVISLYRVNGASFGGFNTLTPVACSGNDSGPGILTEVSIPVPATYMVQISAAPLVLVSGASQVRLEASYTPAQAVINDEPSGARNLKSPGIPSILNIGSATVSANEPVDPLALNPEYYPAQVPEIITNTVWYKFKYTGRRMFAVTNLYGVDNLRFSLFQKNGGDFVPAAGIDESQRNSLTATLEPGTYFLRVGIAGSPQGSLANFATWSTIAYLMPPNYGFAQPGAEGQPGAFPDETGWKVLKGTSGPGGTDSSYCSGSYGGYDCGFMFASSGPTEATVLKSTLPLGDVKVKKGDIIMMQMPLISIQGTPNLKFSLIFTDAGGASLTYNLNIRDDDVMTPVMVRAVSANFVPVRAVVKIKNKDKDLGDKIVLDSVMVSVQRVGEATRHGALLDVPAAWATSTAPKGVLPVPDAPPAQ